jgi:hypothetical protein
LLDFGRRMQKRKNESRPLGKKNKIDFRRKFDFEKLVARIRKIQ